MAHDVTGGNFIAQTPIDDDRRRREHPLALDRRPADGRRGDTLPEGTRALDAPADGQQQSTVAPRFQWPRRGAKRADRWDPNR